MLKPQIKVVITDNSFLSGDTHHIQTLILKNIIESWIHHYCLSQREKLAHYLSSLGTWKTRGMGIARSSVGCGEDVIADAAIAESGGRLAGTLSQLR